MPWVSGTFSGIYNWEDDKANGILIRADRHTEQDNTFITGINNCLTKDGQNSPTSNLPMANFRHTNVSNATERSQYLTMGQFQDADGVYYETSGSSNAYSVPASPAITSYVAGLSFYLKASFANTGAATLNVSGLGAKNLTKNGTDALANGDIVSGAIYHVIYDGTQFQIADAISQLVTLTGDVTGSGSGSFTTTISDGAVTFAKIQDVSSSTLLGRTTAATGDVEEVDFIDDDTLATATAINVASAESVKAYVDNKAGLVTYSETEVFNGSMPTSYTDLDLSSEVGSNRAQVWLRVTPDNTTPLNAVGIHIRENGSSDSIPFQNDNSQGGGLTYGSVATGNQLYLSTITDSSGIIEWISNDAGDGASTVDLVTYVVLA